MKGRFMLAALALMAALALAASRAPVAQADGGRIVISQVYGGGGGASGTYLRDYIELFNPGPDTRSLAGLSLQYASATGNFGSSSTNVYALPSVTLQPGQYWLVEVGAPGTAGTNLPVIPDLSVSTSYLNLSGTGAKVALANVTTALGCGATATLCSLPDSRIIDLVAYGNGTNAEGGVSANNGVGLSSTQGAVRKSAGCTDTNNNGADFDIITAPIPRNTATALHACGNVPADGPDVRINKTGPGTLLAGSTVTYTLAYANRGNQAANDVVITDTLPVGVTPADIVSDNSGLDFSDTGTARVWTLAAPLGVNASGFITVSLQVPLTVTNLALSSNTATISTSSHDTDLANNSSSVPVTELQILTIGDVQGTGTTSPHSSKTVAVRGVVYAPLKTQSSSGLISNGFFLQSKAGTGDGNANTSDGIYVFTSSSAKIGDYTPTVGDEIVLLGKVSEYNGLTELASPLTVVEVLAHYEDLDAAVPPAEMVQSAENLESMRVRVTGALVVAPTYLFASTNDTEFYVVSPGSPVGQRSDPLTRRVFRDQFDATDKNYLISTEANVLKAKANDYSVQLPAANVYDKVEGALVGPLYYGYGRYTLMVETTPTFAPIADATSNNPPPAPNRVREFSIATANVENLYDFLDSPTSACDFNGGGNTGCAARYPGGSTAAPPFDYPAASLAAYQLKLAKIANQMVNGLHAPDILAIEEAENQDVCTGGGQAYGRCSAADASLADGKLDVLQDLAREVYIRSSNTVSYSVASDFTGGDYRGIIVAFMYRNDRVSMPVPAAGDPVLGARPDDPFKAQFPHNQAVQNPKAMQASYPMANPANTEWLFDRAPQAGLFRVHRYSVTDDDFVDVYAIGNHFKSGPDSSIDKRTQEAQYNAGLVSDILSANPNARVVVLGDLNVYPDGGTGDQLRSLYGQMSNTYYNVPAVSRYSYTYQGITQALDQIFATGALTRTLVAARTLHANADWAMQYKTNPDLNILPRTSDHDSTVDVFAFPAPVLAISKTAPAAAAPETQIRYTIHVSNSGSHATKVQVRDQVPANTAFVSADPGGALIGNNVVWTDLDLPGGASFDVSFTVQIGRVPAGTQIVNANYQVTAQEIAGPALGKLVVTRAVGLAYLPRLGK